MVGGCLKCNSSQGNIEVERILKSNNINYICEYKFQDCKNKKCLPFDFYLPEINACIEFDGQQHFIPMGFGSKDPKTPILKLKRTKINDEIRNKYCSINNIKLIRIPYKDFNNIEEILKRESVIISPTRI
jgi:hypothetical protein